VLWNWPHVSQEEFTMKMRLWVAAMAAMGLMHSVAKGAVDPVLEWNAIALEANAVDHSDTANGPEQGGPGRTARAFAIVHAAMFDACNSIDGACLPYKISVPFSKSASLDAAVAKAAHDALVSLYPRQKATFDQRLAETLQRVPNGVSKLQGQLVGAVCARTMIAARANDGSSDSTPYEPGTLPGDHRPDPLHLNQGFLNPTWGIVLPFGMGDPDSFQIPPPPALDSLEYAAAFNEVKEFGRIDSAVRTDDQTVIGIFWGYDGTPGLGTPPRLYNQITRVIAQQMHNTTAQNARLFALVNLAQADAGVACWNDKYRYNVWRPILGIREADEGTGPSGLGDSNPDTEGDVDWAPLGAPASNASGTDFTPPFPAYASGHATFGASLFQILRRFYGTDRIAFKFVSDEFNGVTTDQFGDVRPRIERSYRTLSQADEENGISRIYLGIHWRFDKDAGMAQGRAIANRIFDTKLRLRRK
jgi:hypothetical protein